MRKIPNGFVYGFYLGKMMHQLKRQLDETLAPFDITNQQARIVGFIKSSELMGSVLCQRDLEDVLELRGSSITSLMKGLEKKGFIKRTVNEEDCRVKEIKLTQKGEEMYATILEIFQSVEEKLVSHLTEEEQETLLSLMVKVTNHLEQNEC